MGGSLRGEVTGDGRLDEVWLAVDKPGAPGCQAFVVARTGGELYAVAIAEPDLPFELHLPAIRSLAAIDDEGGLEVVVDVLAGASTAFAGVFSFGSGTPARLRFRRGGSSLTRDLFAYAGSVGHLDGVDCAGPPGSGRIVVSAAVARPHGYAVTRRFYETEGYGLKALEELTSRRVVTGRKLARFPELAPSPFPSCRA